MIPVKRWYGIVLTVLVVTGAAVVTLHFGGKNFFSRHLVIRDAKSGKVYGRWSMEDDEGFAVEFIHSVNQSPVRETFMVEEQQIRPVAVRFASFGAGMQSELEQGQEINRDGDALVISGFDESYRELDYIVGTVSDHLLFINDEVVSLRDLCGRNTRIKVRIQ